MITRIAVALLLVSIVSPSLAAEDARKPPVDGKRWVELMLGRAKTKDARLTQDGKEYKGKATFDCAPVAGGWAASCRASYRFKGLPNTDEAYLLAWDPVKGQAHWFEASSTGVVHDHVGAWSDEQTITVTHRGLNAKGEEEVDAMTLKRVPGSKLLLTADGKVGTRTIWSFQATLTYQATK